jgi:hypothetical protein
MKKIPTIFVRSTVTPALVTSVWTPGCEWVRDGEGVATVKWDGSAVLIRDHRIYKRLQGRPGQLPRDFEVMEIDAVTGKQFGWVPVDASPADQWHREAFQGDEPDGTYELMGPKVNSNRSSFTTHVLIPHGHGALEYAPRTFDELRTYLTNMMIEGIVWHHPDGRMAKIKRRDFGLVW